MHVRGWGRTRGRVLSREIQSVADDALTIQGFFRERSTDVTYPRLGPRFIPSACRDIRRISGRADISTICPRFVRSGLAFADIPRNETSPARNGSASLAREIYETALIVASSVRDCNSSDYRASLTRASPFACLAASVSHICERNILSKVVFIFFSPHL